MKDYTGNPYVQKMQKSQKKIKAKSTVCSRAAGADGEPSKFFSIESFWRFCKASSGKTAFVSKNEVGITHSTNDDCRFCPFAGGKKGLPENIKTMEEVS